MDNRSAHKSRLVRELTQEKRGHRLWLLLGYSPGLNPT
jgi:hypothetical protein